MDLAPLRVHPRHDVLDNAVLPCRIHALQNHQQSPAFLGIQFLLQVSQLLHAGFKVSSGFLSGTQLTGIARIKIF